MNPRLLFIALAAATLTPEALASAPRYRMVLGAGQAEQGVKTVSLVENPAIQRGWVALSAVDATAPKRFHLSEATAGPQKQVLTGPALIPGQEILRLGADNAPFYIQFDAATIEGTARQFAAQGHHNSTNQDHAVSLRGNVVYESWIVADPARDKSAALGLDVPAGTWMLSVHIPDADYWQTEIVTGNKTGFSIEGLFDTEQLTLSAAKPTAVKMNWYQRISAKLSALGKKEAAELRLALGLEQLADNRAVNIDDTTGAVTLVGPDGQPGEPLPDGEYDLLNGGKLVVAGGIRQDGDGQPVVPVAAATPVVPPVDNKAAADATPAPLAENAALPDVVKALNELIKAVGGKEAPAADPTKEPAAPKLSTALHGVKLADLGTKLADLKLDAIELTEGEALTYNAVSRRLSDSKGALVESGYYAAADGSYFQVSTDQYIWSIDKQTYDAVYAAKLQALELEEVKLKLATQPAGKRVLLHGEETVILNDNTVKSRAALRLAQAEATR